MKTIETKDSKKVVAHCLIWKFHMLYTSHTSQKYNGFHSVSMDKNMKKILFTYAPLVGLHDTMFPLFLTKDQQSKQPKQANFALTLSKEPSDK